VAEKIDPLKAGKTLLESMMKDAQKTPREGETGMAFEDKLKLLDRWMKFQFLEMKRKSGGMGGGFDDQGDEDEAGQF